MSGQSHAAGSPPPTQLAPLVVQGRDTDLVGVAMSASQGIVGAAELEARPFLRRGELLEVVPGVVITQHSGDGKANQYFLRGFNLDHGTDFSLSVDGLPVNMRSHAHGQGYSDLNFIIPELVRQVDYNKGPFFAEVGDFSAAGAAEFRQFDALRAPFATLTVGENGYARFAGGLTVRTGAAATTGALEFTRDNGPWQLRQDSERLNVFLRHAWSTPQADLRLTATAYRGEWRATDQIPQRAVAAGLLDRFGHVDASNGGESDRASLAFDATIKGAEATTRLNAYAIHYRLNLFSNFTYFLDDPVNGDQFNQRDRRWVAGGALTRTWTGPGRGETTIGVQARADRIGELGLHRTAQRQRLSTVRDDEVNEASLGVFARNETRWSDWLRTTAGVRADAYSFQVTSDDARNSGRRLADILSPKAGLALGPWAKTEFYANAGFGFHSNDARGTTIRIDPTDGVTPVDRVTPLARSRGAEIGVRSAAVPGLVTSFTAWTLDLDSELVFVGDAGGTEATGRTRRHGLEWANFYRVSPWLAFDGDLALTQARYRDDAGGGTRIANSISTVLTAGTVFGGREGFGGSVRLRYFGPQPLIEDNSVRAASSLLFYVRLGWRAKSWDVAIDVLNALDRRSQDIAYFYLSRLPGEAAAGVDDRHFHPAEPRTVRLNFTRRF
ncbi:MAG: TonB-dependent receptor [Opitutaceae bacterium]|nr:TonB-dependent receptor [Opitutaceae bacterium]